MQYCIKWWCTKDIENTISFQVCDKVVVLRGDEFEELIVEWMQNYPIFTLIQ